MKAGLGGGAARGVGDMEAAAGALAFLRTAVDLDGRLPPAAAAEAAAFGCLVSTRLAEAVRYSMWCEWASLGQLPVRAPSRPSALIVKVTQAVVPIVPFAQQM